MKTIRGSEHCFIVNTEEWTEWSDCSSTCDGGFQRRTKQCQGRNCLNPSEETRRCNTELCPVKIGKIPANIMNEKLS